MSIPAGLWRQDAGSVALEAAVLTPALLMLGLLIVAGGRVAVAHERVEAAASSRAARAASEPAGSRSANGAPLLRRKTIPVRSGSDPLSSSRAASA